jgi:hypothetical protein
MQVYVNNSPASKSLEVDVGAVPSKATVMVRWMLLSSLQVILEPLSSHHNRARSTATE